MELVVKSGKGLGGYGRKFFVAGLDGGGRSQEEGTREGRGQEEGRRGQTTHEGNGTLILT